MGHDGTWLCVDSLASFSHRLGLAALGPLTQLRKLQTTHAFLPASSPGNVAQARRRKCKLLLHISGFALAFAVCVGLDFRDVPSWLESYKSVRSGKPLQALKTRAPTSDNRRVAVQRKRRDLAFSTKGTI